MKALFRLFSILLVAGCTAKTGPLTSSAEVTQLVEEFGRKLQAVSLLSPNVAEEMSREYSEFVAPDLLNYWLLDPTLAPGRMVSSPWPDRIEISSITQASDGTYVVAGEIVEITSSEMVSGGAAHTIPVRLTLQWGGDRWLITEFVYEEERGSMLDCERLYL
jgi:hypothetical protein